MSDTAVLVAPARKHRRELRTFLPVLKWIGSWLKVDLGEDHAVVKHLAMAYRELEKTSNHIEVKR